MNIFSKRGIVCFLIVGFSLSFVVPEVRAETAAECRAGCRSTARRKILFLLIPGGFIAVAACLVPGANFFTCIPAIIGEMGLGADILADMDDCIEDCDKE